MNVNLINHKHQIDEIVKFLNELNYSLSEPVELNENEIKVILTSKEKSKKVTIEVSNQEDVQRLFMTITVINVPYKSVDDFVSFDEYLKGGKIEYPKSLEGGRRTEENTDQYIKKYMELFKVYGIKLIKTKEQFPGYYPEWK